MGQGVGLDRRPRRCPPALFWFWTPGISRSAPAPRFCPCSCPGKAPPWGAAGPGLRAAGVPGGREAWEQRKPPGEGSIWARWHLPRPPLRGPGPATGGGEGPPGAEGLQLGRPSCLPARQATPRGPKGRGPRAHSRPRPGQPRSSPAGRGGCSVRAGEGGGPVAAALPPAGGSGGPPVTGHPTGAAAALLGKGKGAAPPAPPTSLGPRAGGGEESASRPVQRPTRLPLPACRRRLLRGPGGDAPTRLSTRGS